MTNSSIVTAEELRKRKYVADLKRSYSDILKEAETKSSEAVRKAEHITLEYYVPLLCERLRVEKHRHIDPVKSSVKDVIQMQSDIKATVINDCYWWNPDSIALYWPKWAKDEFHISIGKAGSEAKKEKLSKKVLLEEAELSQKREKEFNLLSSVMQQVKTPPKEPEHEPEDGRLPTLEELQPRTPEPLELYEDAVRAIAEIWRTLANKDTLPTKMEDVFGERIKPSRKFRQRLIKGLDDARASHLHNSLVWLNQLVDDTLEMMDEIEKESINKPGK